MDETPASHRFAIEYFAHDGRRLGQVPVAPDFQPLREWAYFEDVRRGLASPVTAPAEGEVLPVFRDDVGPPYCRGLGVTRNGGPPDPRHELPLELFRELALESAALYVERGEIEAGDAWSYRVCAYPVEAPAPIADAPADPLSGIAVASAAEPIAVVESSLAAFLTRSSERDPVEARDVPVFVSEEILAETCALASEAGPLETGGVLVGRLHRDASPAEVFVELTAQIPARHATARHASFAFTHETWAAAAGAIALRGADELILGWWHSHPRFCRSCPEERWRTCALARPFFSSDDVHLQRTCFNQAYQIALLVSDLPDLGPTPALFGWRSGKVAPRGYRVLAPDPDDTTHPRSR